MGGKVFFGRYAQKALVFREEVAIPFRHNICTTRNTQELAAMHFAMQKLAT